MKIYTKTGDDGSTSLVTGTRVAKYDTRIEAYGTVDELNAQMGLLRDHLSNERVIAALIRIQNQLFVIGSNLAKDEREIRFTLPVLQAEEIGFLESEIDAMDEQLEPMRNFVLPGGHVAVSLCHVARTVCRRAERRAYQLADLAEVSRDILIYLNRLSDYFFTLARLLSKELKVVEQPWSTK